MSGRSLFTRQLHLHLACLEVLVHVRNPIAMPAYDFCEIGIPESCIRDVPQELVQELRSAPPYDPRSSIFGDV